MPIRTIGVGAGIPAVDYSSIASHWAALPATFTDHEVARFRWASSANVVPVTSEVDYTGKTFNGFTLTYEPFPGEGYQDHPTKNSNPLRLDFTKGAGISAVGEAVKGLSFAPTTGPSPIMIRGLQIKTDSTNYRAAAIRIHGGSACVIEENIIEHRMTTGGPGIEVWTGRAAVNQAANTVIRNNVVIATHQNGGGISVNRADGVWDKTNIFGNTVFNSAGGGSTGTGITTVNAYIDYRVANNIVVNFATDVFTVASPAGAPSPVAIETHNATTKTSGTSGLRNTGTTEYGIVPATVFENVTPGSLDLRLRDTATACLGNASATYATFLDILRNPQSGLKDKGAHENQNQGPAPQFAFMKRRSPQNGGLLNLDFPRTR